jgi:murein DD-endopeptidase MepM/ murein hydrolase activator NlpD
MISTQIKGSAGSKRKWSKMINLFNHLSKLSLSLPNKFECFVSSLISKLGGVLRARKGNRLSRLLRALLEHFNIKKVVGAGIALVFAVFAFLPRTDFVSVDAEYHITYQAPVVFITENSVQFPVEKMRITQGYKPNHKALDIGGKTGDPIKPVMAGVVVSTGYSRYGYGYNVVIDHGEEMQSLYAHLSKILVVEGQEIDLDTVLGEMGNTGRSFGSHLHLEIVQEGTQINPLNVLSR